MCYDILLFDADRTLFDFDRSEKEAFKKIAPRYGVVFSEDIYLYYKRINDDFWDALERGEVTKSQMLVLRFERLLDSCGLPTAGAEGFNHEFLTALSEQCFAFDESLPLLTELKRRKKRMFLITNGVVFVQRGRLAISPLTAFFEKIFISDEIGYEKPSIEFFSAVINGISGFDKKRAVVIGDSLTSDVKGANDAGIDCIWFNEKKLPLPKGYEAKLIVNSLKELYTVLR